MHYFLRTSFSNSESDYRRITANTKRFYGIDLPQKCNMKPFEKIFNTDS